MDKEEVLEKIITSIKNNNLSEFENIISKINPESLGEKVFKKY
jgi:ribosomal protein L17